MVVCKKKSANDWIGKNKLTKNDLPISISRKNSFKPRSIFLGSFIKWNSFKIKNYVKKYGFKFHLKGKVGAWNFDVIIILYLYTIFQNGISLA